MHVAVFVTPFNEGVDRGPRNTDKRDEIGGRGAELGDRGRKRG